jgi:hypothetical protein
VKELLATYIAVAHDAERRKSSCSYRVSPTQTHVDHGPNSGRLRRASEAFFCTSRILTFPYFRFDPDLIRAYYNEISHYPLY